LGLLALVSLVRTRIILRDFFQRKKEVAWEMVSADDPYSIVIVTNFDMARRFMIQKVRVEE